MFKTRVTCLICSETLYENEKVTIDGKMFHTTCFKCKYCKTKLNQGNWGQLGSDYYCKTHMLELFKKSGGKYDGKNITDKETEMKQGSQNIVSEKTTTNDFPSSMIGMVNTPSPNYQDRYKLDKDVEPSTSQGYEGSILNNPTSTMQTKRPVMPSVSTPGKDYCYSCSKTVYSTEKITVDSKVFHSDCFRCAKCNSKLNQGTMGVMKGIYYCKTHYNEMYLRGGYDGNEVSSEVVKGRDAREEEMYYIQSQPSPKVEPKTYSSPKTYQQDEEVKVYRPHTTQSPVQKFVDPDQAWKGSPKPTPSNGMSTEDNEALTKMAKLRDSGILTQEEYAFKEKQIKEKYKTSSPNTTPTTISGGSVVKVAYTKEDQELISKMDSLIEMGILTESEKKEKIEMINSKYNTTKVTSRTVTLSTEDSESLLKLQKLLAGGILTQEEYDLKLNQVKEKYK